MCLKYSMLNPEFVWNFNDEGCQSQLSKAKKFGFIYIFDRVVWFNLFGKVYASIW
jgi:hypothetical protein